jgi:hypothetical protein
VIIPATAVKPSPGTKCREASSLSHNTYIQCGAPAVAIVHWPNRPDEPELPMCHPCADHNVKNRGAAYRCHDGGDQKIPDGLTVADDDYADDLEDAGPTPERLAAAIQLAIRQIALEDEIAALSQQLDQKNQALRLLAEQELPAALSLTGLRELPLADGKTVAVTEKIVAAITKADQPAAYDWLRTSGNGDLIKREIIAAFGKGQGALADLLLDLIRENAAFKKQKVEDRESVHWQTLGAFVREQLALGTELPPSIGVTTLTRAVITRPKTVETDAL